MQLSAHLKTIGTPHKCVLSVGGTEKASELTVFLEGPITGDTSREGTWRGLIDAFPHSLLFGQEFLIMTIDDRRQGKIQIISSDEQEAIFHGIGKLVVPLSLEDEEDEILGILNDNNNR